MDNEKLKSQLALWMCDTCNRYGHILQELHIIDQNRYSNKSKSILEERNKMIEQYLPIFFESIIKIIEAKKEDRK